MLLFPIITIAQAPDFGTATGFALYTSDGAVTNTSVSSIAGNIGTNAGAITGFDGSTTVNGNFYTQDDTTAKAAIDLLTAYYQLFNTPTTIPGHAALFGTEVITAGVYGIGGAGSVNGNLTLDAENNANAVFIFKFAGAFTVGAGSTILLSNGALAGNVFWIVEGAISMAANIIMKGTLIAHDAANSLGTSSDLEGRMYSTKGAVNVNTDVITKPTSGGYIPVPIQLLSFTGICTNQNSVLYWSTATETNNKYFTIERSENTLSWEEITRINGIINSSVEQHYSFIDAVQDKKNYYYKLKQTDLDGKFKYSQTVYIKNCGAVTEENISIYPNPGNGKFKLFYNRDRSLVNVTQVLNTSGEKIFEAKGFQTTIDLSAKAPGIYFLKLQKKGATITKIIIVSRE